MPTTRKVWRPTTASDFATAYSEWLASAKTGDKLAQHGLGFLFELRKGIPEMPEAKSLAQAVEWYQAASTQGVAAAQTNLGSDVRPRPRREAEL